MGCQQFRKARGIAARHAAFGSYAVDPDMAPGGGEASSVAGHVVAVNEAEIELGFGVQPKIFERGEVGVIGAILRLLRGRDPKPEVSRSARDHAGRWWSWCSRPLG